MFVFGYSVMLERGAAFMYEEKLANIIKAIRQKELTEEGAGLG